MRATSVDQDSRPRTTLRLLMALVSVMVLSAGLAGCTSSNGDQQAAEAPPAPVAPQAPDLSDPVSAVRSYTDWISYAYRVADSSVALSVISDYEEVRVDSYVQYNLIEERRIEQYLEESTYAVAEASETTATVTGSENWRYRYLTSDGSAYAGPELEAAYDMTYTVINVPERGWVVDRVDAQAREEVQ